MKEPQKEITVEVPELGIHMVLEEWELDVVNEIRETHLDELREWRTHELTGQVTITIIGRRV